MEPRGAAELVAKSKILKKAQIEVGFFIADNDTTCESHIRNAGNDYFFKQSYIIHTTKGVGKHMHEIRKNKSLDPQQELTLDAIKHIQTCFSSVVHQNKGDVPKMKKALENIPYHLFDLHANYGQWCKNGSNKENTLRKRFSNAHLFDALVKFFSLLDARKFCSAASSQANESVNATMATKAPKRLSLSKSESADFRYSATVAQKIVVMTTLEELWIN